MGLHVSHGCFSAGYGKFQHFRRAVAEVVGIPLEVMEGYFDRDDWMVCAESPLAKRMLARRLESLPLAWAPWESDPLTLLLNHSDCEGELRWQDAAAIAERLEEIAPQIVRPPDMRADWDFKQTALEFAAGLRRAAEREEDVTFG